MKARHLALAAAAATLTGAPAAQADSCAANANCAYTAVSSFTATSFPYSDLAVDRSGNVYAVTGAGNAVFVFGPSGDVLRIWPIPGSAATGIGLDPAGANVVVADPDNNQVHVYTPQGQLERSVGTAGRGPGQLTAPLDAAIDAQGNVYVVDEVHQSVQKFDPSGDFLVAGPAGLSEPPSSVAVTGAGAVLVGAPGLSQDGTGALLQVDVGLTKATPLLETPANLLPIHGAVDSVGDIWASNSGAFAVFGTDQYGFFRHLIAGFGSDLGDFAGPGGIAFDPQDNLYVADPGNNRIQKFVLSPVAAASLTRTATITGARTVRLPVGCRVRGGSSCTGSLALRRGSRTLGRRAFSLNDGARANLRVRLNARGARLVRGRRRVVVRTHVTVNAVRPGAKPRRASRRQVLRRR